MKINSKTALTMYKQGKSLEHADLCGEDLSDMCFKNVNLKYAKLENVNFSNSDLSNANISTMHSNLSGAI